MTYALAVHQPGAINDSRGRAVIEGAIRGAKDLLIGRVARDPQFG
jgi:hypothetical protein